MRRIVSIVILLVVVGGVFALGSLRRGADQKPILNIADEVALTVNAILPARQEIIRLVQAPGET
ncbi:MAG: hypothetical protein B6D36_11470, partial [Planctomycetes bacterium UTPLA1]